jgi:hypothetical protein
MFAKGLTLKPKLLYARYAELCGLMLKHAVQDRAVAGRPSDKDAIALLLPSVVTNIQAAYAKRGSSMKDERGTIRFLDCLQIIALHYPLVVDTQLLSWVSGGMLDFLYPDALQFA